jgi:hypothetical protein
MKQAKKNEIEWQKIKLIAGGAHGLEIKYSYVLSIKNKGFSRTVNNNFDLQPHDDLIRLFKELRAMVAKIEHYDYARALLELNGYEPTQQQIVMTEQKVQQVISTIEITGVNISKKKNVRGVIITYKKSDENENVTGHATNWIPINSEEFIYSEQDDIKDVVEAIEGEAYEYEFNDKYADFEQLTIPEDGDSD